MTWPLVPLRRIGRVVNGGTPSASESHWGGDIPWATPVDLGKVNGGTLTTTGRSITSLGLDSGSASVGAGSVLVSTRAPVGYVALVNRTTAFNQGCRGVEIGSDYDPRFLLYALMAANREMDRRANGTTFKELSGAGLKETPVANPPLPAQVAIADHLDRETARIDDLIAEQEALIELLATRRRAWIATAFDRVEAPAARLKQVASIQTGLTLGHEPDVGADLPYLRVANVQAGSIDLALVRTVRATPDEVRRHALRDGDVLMTEGGDLDKLGRGAVWRAEISPCLHQNHVFAVRCGSGLDPSYLTYWMEGMAARQYFRDQAKKTTNLASINSTILGNLPIVRPSRGEQRRIVVELDDQTRHITVLTAESRALVALLKERRAALITAAVTGEIDVTST